MFLELKKLGWQCIPLALASKKPIESLERLGGFIGIHHDGVPESICKEWDKKYTLKNSGLGLITGLASNTSVLDLDTESQDILEVIPTSPLIKRGKNLGSYFFQHVPDFDSKILFGARELDDSVEFLNSNMLVVLPPSIHPKTRKPFEWIGEIKSLKNFTPSQLPKLNRNDLLAIEAHYRRKYDTGESAPIFDFDGPISPAIELDGVYQAVREGNTLRCAHGSQDRLKRLAAKLLSEHTPLEIAIKKLVEYDTEHHKGLSYFKDKSRGKDAATDDVYINATRFYTSILLSVNRQRLKRGEDPLSFVRASTPVLEAKNEPSEKAPEPKPTKALPEITGAMKDFVDYLNKTGVAENTEVYLGASLAWLSMLVASRFAVITDSYTTPANLMIWGVMPSGVGKEAPQNLIQDLLGPYKLLGASNYKSAPSLIMNLKNVFKEKKGSAPELVRPAQRENLILIDECSSLFRIMSRGESYQQDIVETLNMLFSKSSGYYLGDQSVERGARYGEAANPYFTLMGFTTVNHFEAIDGSSIIGNGFFERSLVFMKRNKSPYKGRPKKDPVLFEKLKKFTHSFLKNPVELVDYGEFIAPEDAIKTPVAYTPFPISTEADSALHDYRKAMYEKEAYGVSESFYNRFTELATKLALLHAVSDEQEQIEVKNVEWAISLVEWCYSNASKVFEKIQDGEDVYAKAISKIRNKFREKKITKMKRGDLLSSIRFAPKNIDRVKFLNQLMDMGFLVNESDGISLAERALTNADKRG